ncbi:MAG: CCA tRNA nucleotidyltransferase, partial [Pseudomonadota bacterium]
GKGAVPLRFVGGCVRNALLDGPVTDVDFATVLHPDAVMDRLQRAGVKAVPTGLEHGTVTAVLDGATFEVTTLRVDVRTDGRHADVAFTEDWAGDAARRDFTVNALYADPDGRLFDPLGGLADLRARRIRFIGDAGARIREDYLRILRFFRFTAWYGGGGADTEGLAACQAHIGGLSGLAAERVWSEVKGLLSAPSPGAMVGAMSLAGVLPAILDAPTDVSALDRLVAAEAALGLDADPLRRLAALVEIEPPQTQQQIADAWRLSGEEQGALRRVGDALRAEGSLLSDRDARAAAYTYGPSTAITALLLQAIRRGPIAEKDLQIARSLIAFSPPSFPVSGADLLARGEEPGPELGAKLKALEARWIASDFTLSKQALLG